MNISEHLFDRISYCEESRRTVWWSACMWAEINRNL